MYKMCFRKIFLTKVSQTFLTNLKLHREAQFAASKAMFLGDSEVLWGKTEKLKIQTKNLALIALYAALYAALVVVL
jgi:hypothetical protein